jgi:hypothetical protein
MIMGLGRSSHGHRSKMMWILIIAAVNVANPQDVPGRVTLEFGTQQQCQAALATMTTWIKFDSFRIQARCVQKDA